MSRKYLDTLENKFNNDFSRRSLLMLTNDRLLISFLYPFPVVPWLASLEFPAQQASCKLYNFLLVTSRCRRWLRGLTLVFRLTLGLSDCSLFPSSPFRSRISIEEIFNYCWRITAFGRNRKERIEIDIKCFSSKFPFLTCHYNTCVLFTNMLSRKEVSHFVKQKYEVWYSVRCND